MIYLDGSQFFFNIEDCFSNLIQTVRNPEYCGKEKNSEELYDRIRSYLSQKNLEVRAGKNYQTIFDNLFADENKIAVFKYDEIGDKIVHTFGNDRVEIFHKRPDMKIKLEDYIEDIKKRNITALLLSNPCFPTSLLIDKEEILSFAQKVNIKIVIDESHMIDNGSSLIGDLNSYPNIYLLKQLKFAGNPVVTFGNALPEFSCNMEKEDIAAACVIYQHNSALKTAERKTLDSINSLYIRIKKLAVKFDSICHLYRTKSDNIFLECKNPESIAEKLLDSGFKINYDDKYLWFTSGNSEDNDKLIAKFEDILN